MINWTITKLSKKGNNEFIARYECSKGENVVSGDITFKTDVLFEKLTESKVLELVKTEINSNLDGTIQPNNLKNIEDTVLNMETSENKLPWDNS